MSMIYQRGRMPRSRTTPRSQSSLAIRTEFRETVAVAIWTYSDGETVSELSVPFRVLASQLDRLASLGIALRGWGPNSWVVEGPDGVVPVDTEADDEDEADDEEEDGE
jgi:hypothetical protein